MIVDGATFNSKLKASVSEGTITVVDTDAPSFSLRTKSGSVAFYHHTLPDRSYTLDYRSNQEQVCVRALDVESFTDTIGLPWSRCDISQSKWRKKLQKQGSRWRLPCRARPSWGRGRLATRRLRGKKLRKHNWMPHRAHRRSEDHGTGIVADSRRVR